MNVRIRNYKSFRDSGSIPLSAGVNVVVGPNDVGKSALAEALSLRATSRPHRSLSVVPFPWSHVLPDSTIDIEAVLSPQEIRDALSRAAEFFIPLSDGESEGEAWARFKRTLNEPGSFCAQWMNGGFAQGFLSGLGDRQPLTGWGRLENLEYPDGFELQFKGVTGKNGHSYSEIIAGLVSSQVYAFKAERLNVGEGALGGSSHLQPNASNLPEVLNVLMSSNPRRFERLMRHVTTVFPSITQVTAPTVGNNLGRIMVWGIPSETERGDLAIPLSESGTGVGQVLAILYVVVTADSSRVIIIDEPQSFLHPGAARKLFEILREYPQHQYIITTHSPTSLLSAGIENLLRVRRDSQESVVEQLSLDRASDLRLFLADVGAHLSDLFGADRILWVEGKTEELCFPILLRGVANLPLRGTQLLAVHSTADLEGRLAPKVFDIYRKLSAGPSLIPPAIAFVLDREGRSRSDIEHMDRKSAGQVRWLPRRMFENYLLDATAIAAVLSEEDQDAERKTEAADVSGWIAANGRRADFFPNSPVPPEVMTADWELTVHAAKLLESMFSELTESRVNYDKTRHGKKLSEFLVRSPTTAIRELVDFLRDVIGEPDHAPVA